MSKEFLVLFKFCYKFYNLPKFKSLKGEYCEEIIMIMISYWHTLVNVIFNYKNKSLSFKFTFAGKIIVWLKD
jgi:hypothetical protein